MAVPPVVTELATVLAAVSSVGAFGAAIDVWLRVRRMDLALFGDEHRDGLVARLDDAETRARVADERSEVNKQVLEREGLVTPRRWARENDD